MRTAKALARLRRCIVSPEPSLVTYVMYHYLMSWLFKKANGSPKCLTVSDVLLEYHFVSCSQNIEPLPLELIPFSTCQIKWEKRTDIRLCIRLIAIMLIAHYEINYGLSHAIRKPVYAI